MSYAHKKFKKYGIPVYVFDLDLDEDMNKKACFCRDEDNCPPRGKLRHSSQLSKLAHHLSILCKLGTFDLYRCSGIPMYGSLPHFYKAEELLAGIASGLHPNKSEHNCGALLEVVSFIRIQWDGLVAQMSDFHFQQLTGTPLSAAKRMQFNLEVKPIPEIEMMKNLPEVILPFFWVEESIVLDKEMLKPLRSIFWYEKFVELIRFHFLLFDIENISGVVVFC